MKYLLILCIFINSSLKSQNIHPDSLFKLVISGKYFDSTVDQIKLCKTVTKDSLFKKVRKSFLTEKINKTYRNYVLCYFKYHCSTENMNFLFEHFFDLNGGFTSISECDPSDILATYGKPARKIAKQKSIEAKSYKEFYQYTLVVFWTVDWNINQKNKYFRKLQKKHTEITEYTEKALRGEI